MGAGPCYHHTTLRKCPQPVGYLSKKLDNVAKGWPSYLRAIAAVRMLIPETQKFILGKPLFTPCTNTIWEAS
jgi:hypothetical protein